MKTKLEMAHEWAIELLRSGYHRDDIISCAWQYADAMQAEADKREKEQQSEHVFESVDEWQPDWSQAPAGYDWFAIDKFGAWFYRNEPKWTDGEWSGYQDNLKGSETEGAESFGYQGDWRDSLRKRPN